KIQEFDEAIATSTRAVFESTNRLAQLQTGDYVEILDESRWQIKKATVRQRPFLAGVSAIGAAAGSFVCAAAGAVAEIALQDLVSANADLADLPRSWTGNEYMLDRSNAIRDPYFVKIDGLRYRLLQKEHESGSGFKLSIREGAKVLYTV